MRLFIVGAALLFTTTAGAQTRWTLSAGPEWSSVPNVWGMRLRADYDLVGRRSPLRIALLGGARWGPTQTFRQSLGSGSSFYGSDQSVDLTFGAVAAFTPVPRARVSPYLTFGVLARQTWSYGWSRWTSGVDGSLLLDQPERFRTVGQIFSSLGLGVRAKIAGRMFQVEIRRVYDFTSLTFGTSLPFE